MLQTHGYFVETFLQTTRVDHISRVMSSHPSYLDNFLKTQQFILRGDGPLPFVYRHLIAIMVQYLLFYFFVVLLNLYTEKSEWYILRCETVIITM